MTIFHITIFKAFTTGQNYFLHQNITKMNDIHGRKIISKMYFGGFPQSKSRPQTIFC